MEWMKKKEPSFYEQQKERIKQELGAVKPGTEEYDKLMKELADLQAFAGKEKEMNSFFDKSGRGNIVGKIVGFLGLGSLATLLCCFEKSGHMFSGSNSGLIGSIIRVGAKLFG